MSGQVCPGCGQTTPLYPSAPDEDSIWGLIPKLASIPFSYQTARDADDGRPVMVTGAVPERVAAYQLIAGQVRGAACRPPRPGRIRRQGRTGCRVTPRPRRN